MTIRRLANVEDENGAADYSVKAMSRSYMPYVLFMPPEMAAPRSIVEFAVHPSQENELRTQLLDCGAGERTLIGIQADLHFLRSAQILQVRPAEFQ